MRIVYDFDGARSFNSHVPPVGRGRRETVIVISERKASEDGGRGGLSIKHPDYEVRISDEAVARDREVRAHEQAHMAVLGSAAASPIMYNTVVGPGGEVIATGGSIAVDMSEVPGDPEATLHKAQKIIAAAYAPGNPSAGDMRTAVRAYDMVRKAQSDLREGKGLSLLA
jgi:hypothetical protein